MLAEIAQATLNGTMSANPIGAVISLVGTLVGGVMTLYSWFNKTSDAEAEMKKSQEMIR